MIIKYYTSFHTKGKQKSLSFLTTFEFCHFVILSEAFMKYSKAKLLSPEEFGALYGIAGGTVWQQHIFLLRKEGLREAEKMPLIVFLLKEIS